jgi:hypothetical protein
MFHDLFMSKRLRARDRRSGRAFRFFLGFAGVPRVKRSLVCYFGVSSIWTDFFCFHIMTGVFGAAKNNKKETGIGAT